MQDLIIFLGPILVVCALIFIWWILGVYPFATNHHCKVCGRQVFRWQSKETDPFNVYHALCKVYADTQDEIIASYEAQVSALKAELAVLKPVPGGKYIQHTSIRTKLSKNKLNGVDWKGIVEFSKKEN